MIMPDRKMALEIQQSGDDVLVHDIANAKIHVLNRTAGTVLAACDGRTPMETLLRRLGSSSASVRADVESVLAQFASLGLIDA